MSQQDEGRPPARPRLVFSPEVHEQLKEQFERALMDHPHDEKAAMNSVIEWLWGNRDGEAPAAQAFRQLLDHFIKSAIAQAWIAVSANLLHGFEHLILQNARRGCLAGLAEAVETMGTAYTAASPRLRGAAQA
jgi:hypothetical protein